MQNPPKNFLSSLAEKFSRAKPRCAEGSEKSREFGLQNFSRRGFLAAAGLGFLFCAAAPETYAIDVKGVYYVPVSKLARRFGMRYKTIAEGRRQKIYS